MKPTTLHPAIEKLIDKQVNNGDDFFSVDVTIDDVVYFVEGQTTREWKETLSATYDSPAEHQLRVEVYVLCALSYDNNTGETIADYTDLAREYAKHECECVSEF